MLAKSFPRFSQSYDAKFGMDECARNNYGVTLKANSEAVAETNYNNTGATTLQQFESILNCCKMLR